MSISAGLAADLLAFAHAAGEAETGAGSGICGFDGFIDTFISVANPDTMADFGARVVAAAGISASYPSEHRGDKFGGNGPILAGALHALFDGDIGLTYIGMLGQGGPLPIFEQALSGKVQRIYSLGDPAHSDCLEFRDGKIMLSDLRACSGLNWSRLVEVVGAANLDQLLRSANFIAAVNWGKLPHAGSVWSHLASRLTELGIPKKQVLFFMDLAEFEHRPGSDRRELIGRLSDITGQCRTILSLNLKEAWQLAETIGGAPSREKGGAGVAATAEFLRRRLPVDRIVVHPNDGAACAGPERTIYLPGPYCPDPLTSVGAGDHFGAGCLAAALRGLEDRHLLVAGMCASGYFVRSGKSPDWRQLIEFAVAWSEDRIPGRLVQ